MSNSPIMDTALRPDDVPAHDTRANREHSERRLLLARGKQLARAILRDAHWFAPLLAILTLGAVGHGWLCDDAFISFRYAANLVHGAGLVFNVGERVEGYTNFLWVLEIAALQKLFGLHPAISSIALTVLATLAYLAVTVLLSLSTPFRDRIKTAAWLACALLVINRNVAVWSSSGLETRQFSALVLFGAYFTYQYKRGARQLVFAALAFAFAELTRPEAPLLWGACAIWYFYDSRWHDRFRFKEALCFTVPFVAIVAAHYAFRYWYYGDLLPNTYYAKHVRPWPDAGLTYVTMLITESGLYLVLPVALVGLFWRLLRAKDSLHVLSALMLGLHAIYIIRIGGDHFEFRPFDFYWPLLAVATADGILASGQVVLAAARRFSQATRHALYTVTVATLTLTLAVYSTILQLVHDAITSDRITRMETLEMNAQATLQSAPVAHLLPLMKEWILPVYNSASDFCIRHSIGTRWREHRTFWRVLMREYSRYDGRLHSVFPRDAVMALGIVGVIPYMLRDLTIIDTKGLTDPVVARNGKPRNDRRMMAHDRSPPPGYLESRGVNLYVLPAQQTLASALHFGEFVVRVDDDLWMPFLSDKRDWVLKAFAKKPLFSAKLAGLEPQQSWALVAGREVRGRTLLWSFEDAEHGWTADGGAAATGQPRPLASHQGSVTGYVGQRFVNTYHAQHGDGATGALVSPEFAVPPRSTLAFAIGGGKGPDIGVELREGNKRIAFWTGENEERLTPVLFELHPHAGKRLTLAIVDRSAGEWGHILVDHFILMH